MRDEYEAGKNLFHAVMFYYSTNLSRITGEFWRMRSTPEKMLQNPEYGQLLRGQNTRDEPGLTDIVLFRNPGSEFLVFIQAAAGTKKTCDQDDRTKNDRRPSSVIKLCKTLKNEQSTEAPSKETAE